MKILVQFPTRNRPDRFFEYLNKYLDYAENKSNIIIHVSMDVDDESMNTPEIKEKLTAIPNCIWTYADNKTKHEAVNRRVSDITFDILLLASDDMLPIVHGYDRIIRDDMTRYFPDTDGALWYYDGNRKDINTLQIMGRKYFDRFGYIYREETIAFFGDTEFQEVAQNLNKLVYIDTCIIKHEHYEWNPSIPRDGLYDKNSKFFRHDEEVFNSRKAMGFPK